VRHADKEQLLSRARWARGMSIFRVNTAHLRQDLLEHPWVLDASIYRALPDTLRIELVEQRANAAVLLGHLYLLNEQGRIFKRASAQEADGLPVITGIERIDYLNGEPLVHSQIERALWTLAAYRKAGAHQRPAVSEVHVPKNGEVTIFLRQGGTALRIGQQLTAKKLRRFDAVWAALGPDSERARAVYLDHSVRADRVVVRLGSHD